MSAAEVRVARPSRSSMAVSKMHASSSSGSESSVLGWLGIVLGRCASHESWRQRRPGWVDPSTQCVERSAFPLWSLRGP